MHQCVGRVVYADMAVVKWADLLQSMFPVSGTRCGIGLLWYAHIATLQDGNICGVPFLSYYILTHRME
jgi:hypothetical protein